MLSSNLEKTLREAYQLAAINKHEFVTIEHLLFCLIDDKDSLSLLNACGVDIILLRKSLDEFIGKEFAEVFNYFYNKKIEICIGTYYEEENIRFRRIKYFWC